ncbi:hypothetical protein [Neisseria zalophi]|uniref:hypothetical protein n=1 Tax=Neisseria zalophi TaxID=640030 RepID=UPI0017839A77|nr:hypothetical protein [Neisseria zalophi]
MSGVKGFFVGFGDSAEFVVFELCYVASLVSAVNEVTGFIVAVAAFDGGLGGCITRPNCFAFGLGNGI